MRNGRLTKSEIERKAQRAETATPRLLRVRWSGSSSYNSVLASDQTSTWNVRRSRSERHGMTYTMMAEISGYPTAGGFLTWMTCKVLRSVTCLECCKHRSRQISSTITYTSPGTVRVTCLRHSSLRRHTQRMMVLLQPTSVSRRSYVDTKTRQPIVSMVPNLSEVWCSTVATELTRVKPCAIPLECLASSLTRAKSRTAWRPNLPQPCTRVSPCKTTWNSHSILPRASSRP
mmetsp:Transcript_4019/g.12343  ORF Transcript_4019/g.12343 Transcript_4019/m.12343 type:complete len:231 (-) Transcript_4019:2851-3543(-)